jgi:hypothetical protein
MLFTLVLGLNTLSTAKINLSKVSSANVTAGFDVNRLTSGILRDLGPDFNLIAAQKTTVTSIMNDFFVSKSNGIGHCKTNQILHRYHFALPIA